MLLSPIFLAMGAVATSVLNANGRFTAAAIAPITYNLAIIGAALILAPAYGVAGIAAGVVFGSLAHLLVQVRPVARLGFRFAPRIDLGDAQARKALALMAPRAIGLGATQITFVVVTSLATNLGVGAVTAFNVAFTLLQIPIGVIGVPLGVVVFPSLSREAATGRDPEFVSLLDRALRLLIYVMVPIGAPGRDPAGPDRGAPLRRGPVQPGGADPHREHAARLPGRPGRPCPDRRARPGVLRPAGHAHAGPRRGPRGGRQHLARGRPRRPVRAARHRAGDRHRRVARGARAPR